MKHQTSRMKLLSFAVAALLPAIPGGRARGDDPKPDATKPDSAATSPSTTTPPVHKPLATNVINGKVEKVSPNSITLKVMLQTVVPGKVVGGHYTHAHMSSSWIPHLRPGQHHPTHHVNHPHMSAPHVRTMIQTMTFNFADTPPVKVVTTTPRASRTTGSYADVQRGDLVMVGLGPIKTKDGSGNSVVRNMVTGIDVLKNNQVATSNKPKK